MGAGVQRRANPSSIVRAVRRTSIYARLTTMNTIQRFALNAAAASLLLGLGACENMSRQDKNTAIGAGAGAVGGAVITGGSAVGTAAGAVVGGVIGHEVDKKDKKD